MSQDTFCSTYKDGVVDIMIIEPLKIETHIVDEKSIMYAAKAAKWSTGGLGEHEELGKFFP